MAVTWTDVTDHVPVPIIASDAAEGRYQVQLRLWEVKGAERPYVLQARLWYEGKPWEAWTMRYSRVARTQAHTAYQTWQDLLTRWMGGTELLYIRPQKIVRHRGFVPGTPWG
jgi:hypothetical protein